MSSTERPRRARPVNIMEVVITDDEDDDPKRSATQSSTCSRSAAPTPFGMTDRQIQHLLLAKGMVAVRHDTIMRRLQRRLCTALQAPGLHSSGRVKIVIDGFEHAVLPQMLPSITMVDSTPTTSRWVADTPDSLKRACLFPFHALGHREAKLFKPKRVRDARAICFYSPPMEFNHITRTVAKVQECSLVVYAQIAMLNHANVLWTATPQPAGTGAKRAFEGYSEEEKVAIKERGVLLLKEFMRAPVRQRIPLSSGLIRVAEGWSDGASDAASEASAAEGEFLEPIPLPGVVDTFDAEGETFE